MHATDQLLSLHLKNPQHDLQVLSFSGEEAISMPYRFNIEAVSEDPQLDLDALLHQMVFLAFNSQGAGIHGQIQRVEQGISGMRLTHYRLTLVPRLSYLQYRINHRIFQARSVQQIIEQILKEHGLFSDTCQFRLTMKYKPREYCVQYGESDLQFVQRLCAEEGLHYHFEHSRDMHILVFADHQTMFRKLGFELRYQPVAGLQAETQVVRRLGVRLEARTARTTRRDYDFRKAGRRLEYQAGPDPQIIQPNLEDYRWPGRFTGEERGKPLTQRALESRRADYRQADGESDHPGLVSGHFVALTDHPRTEWNDTWLLTRLEHQGYQPQVLEEAARKVDGMVEGYRNRFTATPSDTFFRPPLPHSRPKIAGSQTARVTGPDNHDVHCDEYGRIKVQFHWDRNDQAGEFSSCWLRVASSWAGDTFGATVLPRVGMEVLVSFLEGDPDHPIVSGCLPNNLNMPPYPLPERKTRSVLRSHSTPHNGGFSELHIEDLAGQELIYLRAQRDMEQKINHDSRLEVGNDRQETIKGNSTSVLEGEEQRTVNADRKTQIKADDYLQADQNRHVRVGQILTVEAGQQVHIKSGAHLIIDGGASITLKAGGQHLLLGAGGIFSSSPILPGGVPLPGAPALAAQPAPLTALQNLTLNVQKQALRNAAGKAAPVCAVCHKLKERNA
ncbi:type VI secretion system tip protein VgrG [Pseudomonas sp. 21LCFQ010]|uniref:type VI secretion system Vgr family protein n=1 Tax=Pseudomonas sp. 21LCFQ010 TaxID=2957506 RepID=UPI0020971756|nr:type VI secretion system tip protein VgrG [Pseudomonas sp. 21LCFQ010]MCO8163587.1 type VI secretion system tip protein VgrG [Pseudomonas sp. 21LCFQ010]